MKSIPKGLVSVSDKVSAELGGIDAVDIGDIVQLWKAYNTNPSAHEGNAGYRLQNFFWRIWSSERLSTSLTGSKLARLFLQISEPTATNTTIMIRPASKGSETHLSSSKSDGKYQHPAGHPSSAGTTTKPLPPILKKSNSSPHGETQKTTRLLLTGLGGKSVTRKPSNPPTPIPPSRPAAFDEQVQGTTTTITTTPPPPNSGARPSQKKTFTVASKAKGSKRRPVLMRRKSSQQSSILTPHANSPHFQSPPSDDKASDMSIVQEAEIYEEAVEDSPDEPTIASAPFSSPTMPAPAPDPSAGPAPDPAPDTDVEENPQLPPALLADLKALLHKNTPLPPLRPRSSPPLVGFFSATACRYYDVRNVSQENYEQPKPVSALVDRDFRARFAEQKRLADEYYAQYYRQNELGEQQMPPSHDNVNTDPNLASDLSIPHTTEADTEPRVPTRTGTAETDSPSKSPFSNSHPQSHGASTIATSILASGSGGPHQHLGNQGMFSSGSDGEPLSPPPQAGSAMAVPVPMQAPGGTPFLQSSALSVPRGPSGLSLLIEQSRSMGQETGMAMRDEYFNIEDHENEEP